jgi:FAD:protein FMN transferase
MHITFEAIGTFWQIDAEIDESIVHNLEQEIRRRIELYDQAFSRFRTDSLVWNMFTKPGTYTFPPEAKQLLSFYKILYDKTDGLFTPLIGTALSEAGYDKDYSLLPKKITTPPMWQDAITVIDNQISSNVPILLDTGAAGKGHIIDIIGQLLEDKGITHYCIDAGGDIRQRGTTRIRIGLEDPNNPKKVLGFINLHQNSICGSAGNRRAWSTYTHIMNPKTLISPTSVLATWVVAKETMIADGLSTCFFFVEPERFFDLYKFEYVLLYPDYSVKTSKQWDGELFTN